jgi:hypothetical protein
MPARTPTREPDSCPQVFRFFPFSRTKTEIKNGKPNGKRKPLSINDFRHFFPFFRLISPLPHKIPLTHPSCKQLPTANNFHNKQNKKFSPGKRKNGKTKGKPLRE